MDSGGQTNNAVAMDGGDPISSGRGNVQIAAQLRERGNEFFGKKCFEEAANRYKEALTLLHKDNVASSEDVVSLGQALRLNLATCYLKLNRDLEAAISLCDEVLVVQPTHVKAMFRRGSLRYRFALEQPDSELQRDLLQQARKDVLQAARAEPSDRQIREVLDEITEEIRRLPSQTDGLLAFCGDLYENRADVVEVPAPVACTTCGRTGHACCGKAHWISQRAKWLRVSEEEVARDPSDFEDHGTLYDALMEARGWDKDSVDNEDVLSDLSEEEHDDLWNCIESIEKPYPKIKKKLPLVTAIRCAEEIWADDM